MLKKNIELIKESRSQVVLSWHKPDGEGGFIPIAIEFADDVDDEMRQRVVDVSQRPLNVMENGHSKRVLPGSSAHFLALPKVLARLGFRTRVF